LTSILEEILKALVCVFGYAVFAVAASKILSSKADAETETEQKRKKEQKEMCEAAVKEYKGKIEERFERHGPLAIYGGVLSFSQFDLLRKIIFFESKEEANQRGPSESRKVPEKKLFSRTQTRNTAACSSCRK